MTKTELIRQFNPLNQRPLPGSIDAFLHDLVAGISDTDRGTATVADALEWAQRRIRAALDVMDDLPGLPFDSEPNPPSPAKVRVLIEVDGGCVSAVHCDAPGRVDCTVLDHDNPAEEGALENDLAVWFADGTTARKFLQQVALANPAYETVL
jgi:hypothetical protein